MANEAKYRITAIGPDADLQAVVARLDAAHHEVHLGGYADVYWAVHDFVAAEDEDWWALHLRNRKDLNSWDLKEPGRLELRGCCKWHPPLDVVHSLSREFPRID